LAVIPDSIRDPSPRPFPPIPKIGIKPCIGPEHAKRKLTELRKVDSGRDTGYI